MYFLVHFISACTFVLGKSVVKYIISFVISIYSTRTLCRTIFQNHSCEFIFFTDAQMVKNVHRQFANGTPKQSLSFPGASSPPGDGGVLVSLHHMQVTAEQRHAELEVIIITVTTVCATSPPLVRHLILQLRMRVLYQH